MDPKIVPKRSDFFKMGCAVFQESLFSGTSLLALSVCFRFDLLLLFSGLFDLSSEKMDEMLRNKNGLEWTEKSDVCRLQCDSH